MTNDEAIQWIDKKAEPSIGLAATAIIDKKGLLAALSDSTFKSLIRNTPGGREFLKKAEPVEIQLDKELKDDDLDLTDNEIWDLAKKYKVSSDEVKKVVESLKQEKALDDKAKQYEEDRNRRKKEIENAGFFSPWTLASDYSKQRYIDDPSNSIFGKEGKFDPYSTEGQMEISDLLTGAVGAVGDLLPKGLSLFGTAARTGRDLIHKLYGSDYQKSKEDIMKDLAIDAAMNIGPQAVIGGLGGVGNKLIGESKYALAKRLKNEEQNVRKGLEYLEKKKVVATPDYKKINKELKKEKRKATFDDDNWERISKTNSKKYGQVFDEKTIGEHARMSKVVAAMPDSPMKNDLMQLVANPEYNPVKMKRAIRKWQTVEDPEKYYLYKYPSFGTKEYETYPTVYSYKKQRLDAYPLSPATKALSGSSEIVQPALREIGNVANVKNTYTENDADKMRRWQKGFATYSEQQSQEYKDFIKKKMGIKQ